MSSPSRITLSRLLALCFELSLILRYSTASWWLLAMPSAYHHTLQFDNDYKDQCRRLNYLVPRQRDLCALSKNMLAIVSKGAQMGLHECQNQFSGRHWNCSTQFEINTLPAASRNGSGSPSAIGRGNEKKPSSMLGMMQADSPVGSDVGDVFGGILKFHSREKAYVHSITAAGVAFSVTRACSQGELQSCSCDKNVHRKNDNKGQWEWGGCSEDISYGERLSKDFVDSNELARRWTDPAPKMMNLHNNEAGRRTIRNSMKEVCKCHGVSGSCTVKICWRRMEDFKRIGEVLYRKFDGATRVNLSKEKHKLKPVLKGVKKPTKRDLIYLQESPDFCQENPKYGIVGTRGRKCNRNSYGTDSCQLLCCSRGYVIKEVEQSWDCNCKFVWCCEVKCEKCVERVEEYYCK